ANCRHDYCGVEFSSSMPAPSKYNHPLRQSTELRVGGSLRVLTGAAGHALDGLWSAASYAGGWHRLAISAFLLGLIVALMYRPFSTIENGDASIYDYIAQTIIRGGLPYRDVLEIKAPGSIYLSALAMWIGRHVAISDVVSVRILNILMAGALSFLTFVVAWTYLRSRLASVIAILVPLM